MRVLHTALLGTALLVLAGSGSLYASQITQSSEPFFVTGRGYHSWDWSHMGGGYQMWGSGTNGVDTLFFNWTGRFPFGHNRVEGQTLTGPTLFHRWDSLSINGNQFDDYNYWFGFSLGDESGYLRLYDRRSWSVVADVRMIGFFHEISYSGTTYPGAPSSNPRFSEGTFLILPYPVAEEIAEPVPEGNLGIASLLVLGCLGVIGGKRTRHAGGSNAAR